MGCMRRATAGLTVLFALTTSAATASADRCGSLEDMDAAVPSSLRIPSFSGRQEAYIRNVLTDVGAAGLSRPRQVSLIVLDVDSHGTATFDAITIFRAAP